MPSIIGLGGFQPYSWGKSQEGNALRAFPGSFRNFSGISSGKSQPYWGYGPLCRKMGNPGLGKRKSPSLKVSSTLTLRSLFFFFFRFPFCVFQFPLFFSALFLSFPRILGVPRREKPVFFSGFPSHFSKRARVGQGRLVGFLFTARGLGTCDLHPRFLWFSWLPFVQHSTLRTYRPATELESPEIQKYPPSYKKETPRHTFSDTLSETQKIRNSYFWGVFFVCVCFFFF